MRRGLLVRFARVGACSLALSGCVQATRHSNTMLFGTTTQFGIRAGQSATSVPEVNVGYSRQEAVVMPLVANTRDNGRYQTPCDPAIGASGEYRVHPCLLVGVYGSAQDSYSVLASFGAQFDGSVSTGGTGVKGGLAQYFATGVAAQMLALTGGASVVALGEAAKASAENTDVTAPAAAALFGADPQLLEGAKKARASYRDFLQRLADRIQATSPPLLDGRVDAFAKAVGSDDGMIGACKSGAADCVKYVEENRVFSREYQQDPRKFEIAYGNWSPT